MLPACLLPAPESWCLLLSHLGHPPAAPLQVLLGDLPADTTGQRLADAILASTAPLLLGSLAASAASAIVLSQGLLDSGAPANPLVVAAAAALPLAAALVPVVAPLGEVARFAGMSAAQIEDTVRLKEPIQVGGWGAACVVRSGWTWRVVGGKLLARTTAGAPRCCS